MAKNVVITILANSKPFTTGFASAGKSAQGFGNVVKGVAKATVGMLAAAGAAVVGLAAAATKAYAEYEQLSNGVTTLFGEANKTVEAFARNAAQSAGVSTTEYLRTVTSFSAALLQGLKGDQETAAKVADMAIVDMADNANTFGTAIENIQNAYQGFAKDNFMMLDNLKLGYGGTASEMARLINDSGVLGSKFKATKSNVRDIPFDKMAEAIHVIQERMGIAGVTAERASTTIMGSFKATKASLENFVLGFAQADANVEELIDNLVTNVTNLVNNVVPVIGRIAEAIPLMIPGLLQALTDVMPQLLPAGAAAVDALIAGIVDAAPKIIDAAVPVVLSLVESLLAAAPAILAAGFAVVITLVQGITKALPDLLPVAVETAVSLVDSILENLPLLLDAGIELLLALVDGLVGALPTLVAKLPAIVTSIVQFLVTAVPKLVQGAITLFMAIVRALPVILPLLIQAVVDLIPVIIEALISMLPVLLEAGVQLFMAIVEALPVIIPALIGALVTIPQTIAQSLVDAGPALWDAAVTMFGSIVDSVASIINRLQKAGQDIVAGLWAGITAKWNEFTKWWNSTVGGIVSTVQSVLGIHSPSRVFAEIGVNVLRGLERGLSSRNRIGSIMSGLTADLQGGIDARVDGVVPRIASGGGMVQNYYDIHLPVGMPSAEAGRAVIEAIEAYERAGGSSRVQMARRAG